MDMFDINDSISKINANYAILAVGVYLVTQKIKNAFPNTEQWKEQTDRFVPLIAILWGCIICFITRDTIGAPFDKLQKLSWGDAVCYGSTVGASCSLVYGFIKNMFRKWKIG